jgi:hypothetical protein
MKFTSILLATTLLAVANAAPECSSADTKLYAEEVDYSSTLQDMIDEASRSG